MGKDHYDAILASAPLNETAGRVTSRGYQYTPNFTPNGSEWDAPPKMRQPDDNMPNLVGTKFGRLTVVGLLNKPARRHGALWVCRCACGQYVGRRARAIRNPENSEDRCSRCRHTAYLAKEASGARMAERKASGHERLFGGGKGH